MREAPTVLISPSVERRGQEFSDFSVSLSAAYQQALVDAGAVPVILPATGSRTVIAECVKRSDGVLMTGGEDIDPHLYANGLPPAVRRTVHITEDGGERDLRELMLIDEVFRQRRPLLAICRGYQLLNVSLGGSLVADIRRMVPGAINHRRMDKRNEVVHEARLTPDSLLAKIVGRRKLGVNSTHHQAVGRVAEPLQVVAASSDGIIEGLELKPGASCWLPFLLGVQFHPERMAARHAGHRAIFRAFTQACARERKENL
jgi:putative glutamine amidotransferase